LDSNKLQNRFMAIILGGSGWRCPVVSNGVADSVAKGLLLETAPR